MLANTDNLITQSTAQQGDASVWGGFPSGLFASVSLAGVGQGFRRIAAGIFLMGSVPDEVGRNEDETQHRVSLTHNFWLADTPVTQALWEVIMGNNPSRFKGANRPVENVSWEDAQAFITKVNHLQPGLGLCLPTEAQWEYACRAGSNTPFSFGENITPRMVNYNGSYPYRRRQLGRYRRQTVEVKALSPNAWGLYGMHGNVWEWCKDWHGIYPANISDDPIVNPQGADFGVYHVLRGGSWLNAAADCRSACRAPVYPDFGVGDVGFRLAASV